VPPFGNDLGTRGLIPSVAQPKLLRPWGPSVFGFCETSWLCPAPDQRPFEIEGIDHEMLNCRSK
jgi:hypothetical protein